MSEFDRKEQEAHTISVATEVKPQVQLPRMYNVILINDDFTPMDFVVMLLVNLFGMNEARATLIMMEIHTIGKGICGMYSREIAETKVAQVNEYSRSHDYPLLCTMEVVA